MLQQLNHQGNAKWMTFLWLSLDREFGKPNDGLCYVALSLVSLRLVLSLIWVFGIEFDMLEFSIEFEMEFGIEFDMLEFSIKFGTEFRIEFDIEFDKLEIGKLEIGIECGKLSNFVHNGFP